MESYEQLHILIVDDIPENLLRLKEMLRPCSAVIHSASRATAALEVAGQYDLALVILDIEMPELNGYELANQIRLHPRHAHTPVIFLTAVHFDQLSIYRGYKTGAVDYLTKPIHPDILLSKVCVFLDLKKVQLELQQARLRYLNIIEDQTDFIFRLNPDFTISFVNRAFCQFSGRLSHELTGTNFFDMVLSDDLETAHEHIGQLCLTHPIISFDHRFDRSIGNETIWVNHILRVFHDEEGKITEYQSVCRNITLAKEVVNSLTEAKEKAETANHNKSLFLARMSHEIRTPMSGILGMAEMLRSAAQNEEQAEGINLIYQSASSLLGILNEILDFSKIEANEVTLHTGEVDLRELLREITGLFKPRAQQKGLVLTQSVEPRIPGRIITDPLRLRQILTNLLNNSLKFTTSGEIKVMASLQHTSPDSMILWFAVRDTGEGISEENQEQLFQPFFQASPHGQGTEGTGLGLAISRRLAELLGGEMHVNSQPGCGSEFSFTIRAGFTGDETTSDSPENTDLLRTQPCLRTLIVEDNLLNQKVAAATVRKLGHQFEIAENGEIALNLYKSRLYDLIIMDIQMPVMNGLEATRAIRTHERSNRLKPVKIIALTANALAHDRKTCLDAGMDDYISKPFRFEEFQKVIQHHFPY